MNPVDSVHALLFVADAPLKLAQLATALALTEGQVEQALEVLRDRLDAGGPIQLLNIAGGYQLSTRAEYAEVVANLVKPHRNRMTRSLLEVLAIVAYQQPLTMAEIDAIRGVQSDYAIRTLLDRRLLREVGRRKAPGRPILYGTSAQFLHQFNLSSVSELPPLAIAPPPADQPVLDIRAVESESAS